jgi:hypothetical protein
VESIYCHQCQSYQEPNCIELLGSAKPEKCPDNMKACVYNQAPTKEGKEVVYRNCALQKLENDCLIKTKDCNSETTPCMMWCDYDGCNNQSKKVDESNCNLAIQIHFNYFIYSFQLICYHYYYYS